MTKIIGNGCIAKCDIFTIKADGRRLPSYMIWKAMLTRCYSPSYQHKFPAYNGCSVDTEWLLYSNFNKWYELTYPMNGNRYQLDKDILIQGNKVYSKSTCCWVPANINKLLTYKKNGNIYSGIYKHKNSYSIRINDPIINTRVKFVVNNLTDAIETYKLEKTKIIKKVALDSYNKNEISLNVYNCLISWVV